MVFSDTTAKKDALFQNLISPADIDLVYTHISQIFSTLRSSILYSNT